MGSSALKLRVTIIGGTAVRLLYGTRFKLNRVLWVTGLLLLGLYLFVKWFISQLDPILFLLWAIVFGWTLTLCWVAGLHMKLRRIEGQLEDHQEQDHIEPSKEPVWSVE